MNTSESVTAAAHRGKVADDHLKRFDQLSRKYGMRLPTIADRLGERFVRPLAIDELTALVRPAFGQLRRGQTTGALARLVAGIEAFASDVCGAGIDLPGWLESLEGELDAVSSPGWTDELKPDTGLAVPRIRLSWAEAQREVEGLAERE